jgi:hypothetical protein
MDARKDRIGEHAADHALPWAINALGAVPADPAERLEWQQRERDRRVPGTVRLRPSR